MIPDLVARLRVLRDAPGTPRDAPQTHRTAFWARFGLTSTCTPVFASLLGRFLAISMSRAGRPTGVPYAFLQVETHVGFFPTRLVECLRTPWAFASPTKWCFRLLLTRRNLPGRNLPPSLSPATFSNSLHHRRIS